MEQPKVLKYMQLVQFIRSEISNGTLKEGDRIYTGDELCRQFNVSRQTVLKAISQLQKEGILESSSGSFV